MSRSTMCQHDNPPKQAVSRTLTGRMMSHACLRGSSLDIMLTAIINSSISFRGSGTFTRNSKTRHQLIPGRLRTNLQARYPEMLKGSARQLRILCTPFGFRV